jgi:hypothetical protein
MPVAQANFENLEQVLRDLLPKYPGQRLELVLWPKGRWSLSSTIRATKKEIASGDVSEGTEITTELVRLRDETAS